MNMAICEPMPNLMITPIEPQERAELAGGELVRGQEALLLARLCPLVRERNVALDLSSVERIDAAGITALVALYQSACQSGHRFSVTNASPRVAQILSVVGLDRILFSHNVVRSSQYGSPRQRSAA